MNQNLKSANLIPFGTLYSADEISTELGTGYIKIAYSIE